MRAFLISLAFLSNLLGCVSAEKKSILDERARYGFSPPQVGMNETGGVKYVPTRAPEQVIVAWLHAKELPSKDYFWGSWISIVVTPESWEMKKVEVPKGEKKLVKQTLERPNAKAPKEDRR